VTARPSFLPRDTETPDRKAGRFATPVVLEEVSDPPAVLEETVVLEEVVSYDTVPALLSPADRRRSTGPAGPLPAAGSGSAPRFGASIKTPTTTSPHQCFSTCRPRCRLGSDSPTPKDFGIRYRVRSGLAIL
jgi:hypothetical protein